MAKSLTQLYDANPISTLTGAELVELTKSGNSGAALLSSLKTYMLDGFSTAASGITYTPTGTIAATNVQAAIDELDTEKLPKAAPYATGGITVVGAAHTPAVGPVGTFVNFSNEGEVSRVLFDNYHSGAGGNAVTFRKARGTAAAPSAILVNDQLINVAAFGYGATAFTAGTKGGFILAAGENWTDAAQGTYMYFGVVPPGTTGFVTHLRLIDNNVRLGDTGTVSLQMGGANTVIDTNRLYNARSYTVATLPTPGTAGRVAWASNCRVFNGAGTQEGAGVGTGGLVTDNGTAWKIAGTNVTAVA